MVKIRPILIGLLLLVLSACSAPAGPECGSDSDCESGEICLSSGGILFGGAYCAPLGGDAGASEPDAGVDMGLRVCPAIFTPESACNGQDDDQDGAIDEGCPCPYKGTNAGVCGMARRDCNGECSPPDDYEEEEFSCDGLDNDCDEAVDEGQPFEGTKVAAGNGFTCAIDLEGVAYCWGRNDEGQLGNGTTDDTALPVEVSLSVTLSEISAGEAHACGIGEDSGAIYCWGRNTSSQAGIGDDVAVEPLRLEAPEGDEWSAVSAGGDFTCAILAGTVYCWGSNEFGQLGSAPDAGSDSPVEITLTENISFDRLSSGESHACARTTGGDVYCWGNPADNRLARSSTGMDTGLPAGIDPPREELNFQARFISVGKNHSCVSATIGLDPVDFDGVACKGANDLGQLGGTPRPDIVDTDATGPIASGDSYSCSYDSGQVECWGANDVGQLGRAPMETRGPGRVEGLTGQIQDVSAGAKHACAATTEGIQCWGDNEFGQLGSTIARPGTVGVACVAE